MKISCRLFGHGYQRATTGFTGIDGQPVFRCTSCGKEWMPATCSAARFFDKSISMTALRQFLFFKGVLTKADSQELVEIHGEPERREDAVKVGVNGHDLRYRAQFWPWTAVLTVTYVKNSIDKESVLSLIDAGGLGVGVGEWRPERKGAFGTYQIDQSRKVMAL